MFGGFIHKPNFFMKQNGSIYPHIPLLLNDSVQLLIQAVEKSADALLCNQSSAYLNETLVGSCDQSASFGDVLRRVLLESSFEGKSVRMSSY